MGKIQLDLSIYTFTLKQRMSKDYFYDFNEFYRKNFVKQDEDSSKVKPKELYERFVGQILVEFNGEYWVNQDKNKAITSRQGDLVYRPGKDIVEGMINGGAIGNGHKIFDIDNNKKAKGKLTNDEVASLPFFIKLWTPPNSNTGILMIQGYNFSGASVATLVQDFLKKFYSKYGATFNREIHVPKRLQKEYVKKSRIKEVKYVSMIQDPSIRKQFNLAFEDSDRLQIELSIKKIKNNKIKKFFKDFKLGSIGTDLSSIGMGKDDEYKTIVYYEDKDGRKAHATPKSKFTIAPTIVLPKQMLDDDNLINLEEISKFTDGILQEVKTELNFI